MMLTRRERALAREREDRRRAKAEQDAIAHRLLACCSTAGKMRLARRMKSRRPRGSFL
jgi:hypothetical protein